MWFKGTWHQTSFHPIFRNKHIMIDLGTGNNNKINWTMEDKQEMIDIIETVYRGARKGRGLVVSPKDYSTKYRYWFFFYFSSPFCWSSFFFHPCCFGQRLQISEVEDFLFQYFHFASERGRYCCYWLCICYFLPFGVFVCGYQFNSVP